jgi:hypothetical protein
MRWPTIKKKVFDALQPEAIYIAQTARPLSVSVHTVDGTGIERRYGGNSLAGPSRSARRARSETPSRR